MTHAQYIRWLRHQIKLDRKERKKLRKIASLTAQAIHDESHGHTPNWKKVLDLIEKYEDDHSPLEDED